MKKTLLGILIISLISCSSDDNKTENNPITTEDVITKNITNLFAGGALGQETKTAYFNLETGLEVPAAEVNGTNWDISFKRSEIRLNGGISGSGNAGALISNQSFEDIEIAPENGYIEDGDGPNNQTGLDIPDGLALGNWFTYTNSLEPINQVYIIRTATNKYAKLQILNYYSDSNPPISATYAFKYVLQPGGSTVLR